MLLGLCGLMLCNLQTPVFAKEIAWSSFEEGVQRSRTENKKVFIHFYANWCGACRIMESKTFKDPAVIAYINENFIPIKVNTDREREAAALFKVRALPDNWFISEDGKPLGHQPGYIPPGRLKGMLKHLVEDDAGQ